MSTHPPAFFKVEGFIYGYNQARVEFDLTIAVDPLSLMDDLDELNEFAKQQTMDFGLDAKHCYAMMCGFCGRPARETYQTVSSFLDAPPKGQPGWHGTTSPGPHLRIDVHAVCNMSGPFGKQALILGRLGSLGSAEPPQDDFGVFGDEDNQYPLNASCVYCMKDSTAKEKLLKCSGCKFTHYCGSACQKKDWSRHKTTCKRIKGARFIDEAGDVKVWKQNTSDEWKKD